MPLTAIAIKNAPDGKLFDGNGLYIKKTGATGKWVYRYSYLKRREMGLGSWPLVSLADARRERDKWASLLARGVDPITERNRIRDDEKAAQDRTDPTLEQAIHIVFEAKQAGLRGDGIRGFWLSPMTTHVIPAIGSRRLSSLTAQDIKDTLAPIWKTKHPTAMKTRNRLRLILRECQLMGFECDPLDVDRAVRMLGEYRHVTEHIAATDWRDIPALWNRLDLNLYSAMCLRWLILTGVRANAARGARVSEVDGDVWTVPAERVKGREGRAKDFRVPLSPPALQMVERARALGQDALFPSRSGTGVSAGALEKMLNRIGEPGRPHGFRSSFRQWVQETDACSWEVAETVLGHTIGSTIERSYARNDLLDRRRIVMNAWADFVTGKASGKVLAITRP